MRKREPACAAIAGTAESFPAAPDVNSGYCGSCLNEPELFGIRLENGWYSAFELCSDQSFTPADPAPPPAAADKAARTVARLAEAPQHPFIRRMYEKLRKYYYPSERS